ncbi:hypothetical protein ISN45_At02g037560 [Arabidopsis thaliana x Arabidopsis arenosa]|uniref:Uncharacterized protein n=1 Tax=Arabidopsis thaliana x Arabidopsis arenosa TaxID=1240361 RepID=A0A8T2FTT0_9BRAS|nr:hypothetical protein ISN45_At02g037560 [Arabidopsis thaliana x Arabidopsis arenosa]
MIVYSLSQPHCFLMNLSISPHYGCCYCGVWWGDEACNFSNNAAVTSLNPSQGTCKFPSSKGVSNGSIADATSMQGATAPEFSD